MEGLYEINEEFHMYVDKYCKLYGYTVQEALKHRLIHEVAEYYEHKDNEEKKVGASVQQNNYRAHVMYRFMKRD